MHRCLLCAIAFSALAASARAQAEASLLPTGRWLITIAEREGTEVVVRMTFARRGDGWEAWSRSGTVSEMLSWRKAFLARVFRKLPAHNALVVIERGSSVRRGDSLLIRGKLVSPMLGQLHVAAAVSRGRLQGSIRRDSLGAPIGSIEGVSNPTDRPVRDYVALAANIRRAIEDSVFDPARTRSKAWTGFFAELDRRFAKARDDVDAMAAFYALKPRLATSHFELFRNPSWAGLPFDSAVARVSRRDASALVTLSFSAPGVAYLHVRRWQFVTPHIERAFARIDSAKSRILVLDLRRNSGGDASSMSPISYLLPDSTPVGALVGRRWFIQNGRAPTPAEMRTFPTMTEEAGIGILHEVRRTGALFGIVPPRQPRFEGPVYLLTDRRTGSASEPLVYVLKKSGRATVIGERTAGAMLSAPTHSIGDGWILVLPEADYYTADGTRLEGVGVTPHVATSSSGAMLSVAEQIRSTMPYAAAVLLGESAGLWPERAQEAERHWLEAHRLEPDSIAPLRGLGFAYQNQKRWTDALGMFEQVLARDPTDRIGLYQLGRTAVFSGQRLDRGKEVLRAYLRLSHTPGLPTHASAHWRLGMILLAGGDRAGARREYELARELEPENADVLAALSALNP